jgi:excisionase family DNA binding protein
MITLTTPTASAISLHAPEGLWLMFVQATAPGDLYGPIKIETQQGQDLAPRLIELQEQNAYDLRLIGLAPVAGPEEAASLVSVCASCHLRNDWFSPCSELLALVADRAQDAIEALLAKAHPGALEGSPVDIEGIATVLGVSVPTVRRLVKSGQIPYMKFGRNYRFIIADVLASLERH